MIKVLIVEDYLSMSDALSTAFAATGKFCVVGRISSARTVLEATQRLKPQLVMMDICTAGGVSGLDAVSPLCRSYPKMKIIVMTASDDITFISRAKAVGAHGFVHKRQSLSDFMNVAQRVMAGETIFPMMPDVTFPNGEALLTKREIDVLRLMCKNYTTKKIAETLHISENTVKYHKANLLAKTGFTKNVDLAFYMITRGLIHPMY